LGAPIPAFSGTFDGGGFVISHLTLHEDAKAGLFGTLGSNALVQNLGVADANLVGADGAYDLGILAGTGASLSRVTCCYATGRLSAGRHGWGLGGLIGSMDGTISNCYARTNVFCGEGSSCVGGLLGYSRWFTDHSYAAGAVAATDPNATCGGLIGASNHTTGTRGSVITVFPDKSYVIQCHALAPSDGGGPDNGFCTPLTDAQMKQQTSFPEWDFQNLWTICESRDYPRLWWERIGCDQP
jgi:hypothetical protein